MSELLEIIKKRRAHKRHTWAFVRLLGPNVKEKCTGCNANQTLGRNKKYTFYPKHEKIMANLALTADDSRYRALLADEAETRDRDTFTIRHGKHWHVWVHATAIDRATGTFTDHCACSATREVGEAHTWTVMPHGRKYKTETKHRLKQIHEILPWRI